MTPRQLVPALGRPLAGDSYLHRRNPTVKFAIVLTVSAVLTAVLDPWTPAILYPLAVAAVHAAGSVPWRTLAWAQIPFLLFGTSLFVVNALTRPGRNLGQVGPFDISAEGVGVGTSLALRTLLIGTLSVGFVLTTDGARLMASLHQQVRLPAGLTYAILAGYRLLEQMPEQWQVIRQAQAARRPPGTGRDTGPERTPRALSRAAFTLLVTTIRRAERMSIAMETRGLGGGQRTVFRPVPLDRHDAVLAVVASAVLAVVLVVAWRVGWLVGLGVLF